MVLRWVPRAAKLLTAIATLVVQQAPARAEPSPAGVVVGASFGVAVAVGSESAGVGAGYSVRPRAAYELPFGLAPLLAISVSRWGISQTTRWELSGLAGLRWVILRDRFGPWVEAALGYGQLVHDSNGQTGRVDIGLRTEASLGVDYSVTPWARISIQVTADQIYGGGTPGYDSTWLGVGAGVTMCPF
jgi:hypothetical protein